MEIGSGSGVVLAALGAMGAASLFGVDIEADVVRNRALRASRAAAMVEWLRTTYPDLPLGGIVPRDALAWWVVFPYAEIRANTDAVLGALLGLDAAALDALRRERVI